MQQSGAFFSKGPREGQGGREYCVGTEWSLYGMHMYVCIELVLLSVTLSPIYIGFSMTTGVSILLGRDVLLSFEVNNNSSWELRPSDWRESSSVRLKS